MTRHNELAKNANRNNSLATGPDMQELLARLTKLERENQELKTVNHDYRSRITCDVTRDEFLRMAGPVTCEIAGQQFTATVRRDKGEGKGMGWYAGGKAQVQLGISGKFVEVQVGLNITVIGSKYLPSRSSVPDAQ